jgi:hypothetical protein
VNYRTVFERVFLLIGAGFAVVALFSFVSTLLFLQRAVTTTGVIAGYRQRDGMAAPFVSGDGVGTLFYATVQYHTSDGQLRVFSSPIGTNRRDPPVGTPVKVVYLPGREGSERIRSLTDLWGRAGIFAGLSLLFGLISLSAPRGFMQARRRDEDGPDG